MQKPGWLLTKTGPSGPERLALTLEPDDDAALLCWFVACGLRAAERREDRVAAAVHALRERGLLSAARLASGGAGLSGPLAEAGIREPEVAAARLARAAAALCERFDGSLSRLAGGAPSLEELGTRLVSLGPGFGPGTALRFLRPLRDVWPAAEEVPLDPAALAAAVHLGWLDEFDDPETAPGTLRRLLEDADDAPSLPRVEDALERLGRAACRRNDTRRCPLAEACPARG